MYSSAALGAEQMLFDRAPQLSGAERRRVFELPVAVWSAANDIQSVLRIPTQAGRGYRFEAGHRSEMKPAT
jgi:hypothetical protein